MKVISMGQQEDCFDGSYIREAVLDQPIDSAFVEYLGKLGRCCHYRDFQRPFFTVTAPDRFKIKGIEGNNSLRLIIFKVSDNSIEKDIISTINRYTLKSQ